MNRIITYRNASIAAYCVAALNIIPVVLTLIFPGGLGLQTFTVFAILLGLASPILTLLVVRMLPCNRIARFCGYGAQVINLVAFIVLYFYVNVPAIYFLLLVGTLAGLIWVALASWESNGAIRIVGLLFVFLTVITNVISLGTYVDFYIQLTTYLINGVWFFLVARLLGKISNVPPLLDEVDAPADTDGSTSEVTL